MNNKMLVSKITQLQLTLDLTQELIYEVDLDLAAFANKETYDHKMFMTDVVPIPTCETYNSDCELEELLMDFTDDSFELENKLATRSSQ